MMRTKLAILSMLMLITARAEAVPVVNAGADGSVTLPNRMLTQDGTTTDATSWHWTSPTAAVQFISPNAVDTVVILPAVAAPYTIILTANGTTSDSAVITVQPSPTATPTATPTPLPTALPYDQITETHGTFSEAPQGSPNDKGQILDLNWVTDAAGEFCARVTGFMGTITRVDFDPSATAVPTGLWTAKLTDSGGTNVLVATGDSLATNTTTTLTPFTGNGAGPSIAMRTWGNLGLVVSGAGANTAGRIRLYIRSEF